MCAITVLLLLLLCMLVSGGSMCECMVIIVLYCIVLY